METDRPVIEAAFRAMEQRGGGFAAALAVAWSKADLANRRRIERAFPELIGAYVESEEPRHVPGAGR